MAQGTWDKIWDTGLAQGTWDKLWDKGLAQSTRGRHQLCSGTRLGTQGWHKGHRTGTSLQRGKLFLCVTLHPEQLVLPGRTLSLIPCCHSVPRAAPALVAPPGCQELK